MSRRSFKLLETNGNPSERKGNRRQKSEVRSRGYNAGGRRADEGGDERVQFAAQCSAIGLKERGDEERVFAQFHGAYFTAVAARDHFQATVFQITGLGSV
jgi:hypothetical protein